MSAYPESFPLTQLTSIVAAVRSGTIKNNLNKSAHDIWCVQGYAQKSLLGDPSAKTEETPAAETPKNEKPEDSGFKIFSASEEEEAVVAMETAIAKSQDDSVSTQASIPWDMIISFLISLSGQLFSNE